MDNYSILERIRLEEIDTLNEVIAVCKEILKCPICPEQAEDAKEELDLAVAEVNKLVLTIRQ